MLKKAARVDKGSATPNKQHVGSISEEQLRQIAENKMEDMNARSIEAAMKIVGGAAHSMGIEIK
jgi:large subunit ribosomal protein L11